MIVETNFEPVLQRRHRDPEGAHRHRLTQPDLADVVIAYVWEWKFRYTANRNARQQSQSLLKRHTIPDILCKLTYHAKRQRHDALPRSLDTVRHREGQRDQPKAPC